MLTQHTWERGLPASSPRRGQDALAPTLAPTLCQGDSMNRLKTGDEVIVTAGSHRGERGVVRRLVGSDRVLIENVNLVHKHRKPNPQANQPGGIVEEERPLHVSNVALYNAAIEKGGRVGIKTLTEGQRVRYFKSDGEVIDTA